VFATNDVLYACFCVIRIQIILLRSLKITADIYLDFFIFVACLYVLECFENILITLQS